MCRTIHVCAGLGLAALLAGTSPALAQSEESPDRPRGERPQGHRQHDGVPWDQRERTGEQPDRRRGPMFGDRDIDPAALRARLNNELERVRAHETRLAAAIAALDNGQSPDEVARGAMQQGARRGGEPGRPAQQAPEQAITPEERERTLVLLEEHAPEMGERMRNALDENPRMVDRLLWRIVERQREIAELEQWNPDLAQIRREESKNWFELRAVGMRLREAAENKDDDPESYEGALAEMRGLLGRQFELDTRAKQNEIDNLSAKVDELQTQLDARETDRESLIDQQIERMMSARSDRFRRGRGRD